MLSTQYWSIPVDGSDKVMVYSLSEQHEIDPH